MKQLNLIFTTGSPDAVPVEVQDRRFIAVTLDMNHLRLTILKAMRSGRWMYVSRIAGKIEKDYHWLRFNDLHDVMADLERDGRVIRDRFYFGSDCPSKGDYRGFEYIYRIPV